MFVWLVVWVRVLGNIESKFVLVARNAMEVYGRVMIGIGGIWFGRECV